MPIFRRQPKKATERKFFTETRDSLPLPDLTEIQKKSYDWFLKKGVAELFEEISPISDHSGKEVNLYFTDYRFDEPKYDQVTAQFKDLSYEAPLRVKVKLVNKRTKKEKEQEV